MGGFKSGDYGGIKGFERGCRRRLASSNVVMLATDASDATLDAVA